MSFLQYQQNSKSMTCTAVTFPRGMVPLGTVREGTWLFIDSILQKSGSTKGKERLP